MNLNATQPSREESPSPFQLSEVESEGGQEFLEGQVVIEEGEEPQEIQARVFHLQDLGPLSEDIFTILSHEEINCLLEQYFDEPIGR